MFLISMLRLSLKMVEERSRSLLYRICSINHPAQQDRLVEKSPLIVSLPGKARLLQHN
jgi:hypothetical protein